MNVNNNTKEMWNKQVYFNKILLLKCSKQPLKIQLEGDVSEN